MRRSTLLSIGAGLATAAVLMVFIWFSVGRAYVLSQGPLSRVDMMMVGLLFWGPLTPDALALSFAAGVVVGFLPAGKWLQSAPVRGGLSALAFGAILHFSLMLLAGVFRRPDSLGLVARIPLTVLFCGLFGSIGAAVYVAPAALGAEAGKKLSERPAHAGLRVTALVLAAAVAVISFHGALVRLSVRQAKPNLRAAQQLVRLNLADPLDAKLVPLLSKDYRAKVVGYRLDLKDGDLTVGFDKSGKLRSALLFLVSPGGDSISRETMLNIHQRYRVTPKLTASAKQKQPDWWHAENGVYGVTVTSIYPQPFD